MIVVMSIGLLVLAVISGMLGLGVAFAADPFLPFFFLEEAQRQPLILILNAVTALFAAFGFARSGYIDWIRALALALVATLATPVGVFLALYFQPLYAWPVFVIAVGFFAYRLFRPFEPRDGEENFGAALILSIPIAILGGLLGVGPGFLLLPTLVLFGFDARRAAGMTALTVAPPSLAALVPYMPFAGIALLPALPLVVAGALGAFLGARVTSLYLTHEQLKRLFAVVTALVTAYWAFWLSLL